MVDSPVEKTIILATQSSNALSGTSKQPERARERGSLTASPLRCAAAQNPPRANRRTHRMNSMAGKISLLKQAQPSCAPVSDSGLARYSDKEQHYSLALWERARGAELGWNRERTSRPNWMSGAFCFGEETGKQVQRKQENHTLSTCRLVSLPQEVMPHDRRWH
jgi:hypothetical protein